MMSPTIRLLLLAAILAAAGGCDLLDRVIPSAEETPAKGTSKSGPRSLRVRDASGSEVVSIQNDGSITIEFPGTTLTGRLRDGRRRYVRDTTVVAIAKLSGRKVKIKSPSGTLLWQAKFKNGKVKVADNKSGDNAIEIKRKGDAYKVSRRGRSLGKAKFYPNKGRIKVKDAAGKTQFTAKSAARSASWGILLLSEIPVELRYILMAEIAAAGH